MFNGVADRIIGQLLTELDGIEGRRGVIVVAATNRPELVDSAVLRSGRIDTLIELPMPDREARRAIFAIHLRNRPVAANVSLDTLAKRTDGFSGADIENACRRAANLALSEWLRARGATVPGAKSAHVTQVPTTASVRRDSLEILSRHFESAFSELRDQ
jgi:transitional endoplasmic reticulum ATPase